jgi:hypothetical protein
LIDTVIWRLDGRGRWRSRTRFDGAGWLTPGDREVSKSNDASPATLKFYAYGYCLKKKNGGIPMSSDNKKYPICEHAQRMHDVLLVSSFAVWAMLLGFAPVMTYRLLVS